MNLIKCYDPNISLVVFSFFLFSSRPLPPALTLSTQNFLRCQNNKTNYNLVCETLQFLDCICGSTTGGLGLLGLYINEKNVALINQTLESLTEYCQGPCHENQVTHPRLWKASPFSPCAPSLCSAGLGSRSYRLALSYKAAHFTCPTKGFRFVSFFFLYKLVIINCSVSRPPLRS